MTETTERISAALDELLDLPKPEDTDLSTATESDLWATAKRFRSMVIELGDLDLDLRLPDDRQLSGAQFSQLTRKIIGTFDYVAHRLLELDERNLENKLALQAKQLRKMNEHGSALIDKVKIDQDKERFETDMLPVKALLLLQDYGLYLLGAERLSTPGATLNLAPSFSRLLDYMVIDGLSSLAGRLGELKDENLEALNTRLLKSGLAHATRIASTRKDVTNTTHQPGQFSLIRPGDLGPIAERKEGMTHRYGPKVLEAVFEQQIALIFQSFGFLVVPTKPGRPAVDLLCISNDTATSSQIMVEAKSTKSHYSLPTRDQRALRDYVKSIKKTLRTFPPLKLLLIVAPKPASTLESKLKALSEEISLPVRFLRASVLAALREATPGAIPSELFIEALLAEGLIVESGFPARLAERLDELQNVHRRLAEELESVWSLRQSS